MKYAAFYKRKRIEVEAETSYEAQQKAATQFKARKAWEIAIAIIEPEEEPKNDDRRTES